MGDDVHSRLASVLIDKLSPKERLGFVSWVERNVKLPIGEPRPGAFDVGMQPLAPDIYDSIDDDDIKVVVIMGSVQMLKSATLINYLLFRFDTNPVNTIFVEPTKELSKEFSEKRIAPIADLIPNLSKVFGRKSRQPFGKKTFGGATIYYVSASETTGLASRPAGLVIIDELSKCGGIDAAAMAKGRSTAYPQSKLIMVSSPELDGADQISREYEKTNMCKWYICCPHCGAEQNLSWDFVNIPDNDPDLVYLACKHCTEAISSLELREANKTGRWIATNKNALPGRIGYHATGMANSFLTLSDLAGEYIEAKKSYDDRGDHAPLQIFTQERLAIPFKQSLDQLDANEVCNNTAYPYPESGKLPSDIHIILITVDVQSNRLQYEISGWSIIDLTDKLVEMANFKMRDGSKWGLKRYGIEYGAIMGATGDDGVWRSLLELYQKSFILDNEVVLKPYAMAIDSGFNTERVRQFTFGKKNDRIYPIKGSNNFDAPLSVVSRRRETLAQYNNSYLIFGVSQAKSEVTALLKRDRFIVSPDDKAFLFPEDGRDRGYDNNYFRGLTSEHLTKSRTRAGNLKLYWVKDPSIANEPIDVFVYSYCLAYQLGVNHFLEQKGLIERYLEK